MAELLDRGFRQAPERVAMRAPARPPYMGKIGNEPAVAPVAVASVVVSRSLRPMPRPAGAVPAPSEEVLAALQTGIDQTLAQMSEGEAQPDAVEVAVAEVAVPETAPRARPDATEEVEVVLVSAPAAQAAPEPAPREVVARLSTSGGHHFGINVGRFNTRASAERQLLKTALAETATLNDGLRKVVERSGGYDANFVGLTQDQADLACRRLQARAIQCFTMGP